MVYIGTTCQFLIASSSHVSVDSHFISTSQEGAVSFGTGTCLRQFTEYCRYHHNYVTHPSIIVLTRLFPSLFFLFHLATMSLSLGPHPHGERPSQPTTRASETLRDQLRELEREARLLGNDKSQLEHRLEILHQQIAVSDSKIRAKMEELDRLLGDEQAGEKQLAFEDSVLKDDKIVEALRGEMKKHNVLRIALHAMANGRGTVPHINVLSLALMNQLTRETRLFLSQLAVRVLEYDATHSDEPGVISTPIEIMSEDAAGMAPLPSPPPPSPRVKSEVRSVSTPTRLLQHVPTVATPEMYAPAFSSPVGTGDDPIGMSRLEDQFPGLLASLRASATSQPSNTNTPKRTRQSIESNDSSPSPASPAGKQQAKKAKLEKEPGRQIPRCLSHPSHRS